LAGPLESHRLTVAGAIAYRPDRFSDDRGWTGEVHAPGLLAALGLDFRPVQENQSFSERAGTVRGLHFQRAPHTQAKIVRVAAGAVWSVILDLRHGSPSFETATGLRQSAANGICLHVPAGCAHGVMTLEDNTVLNWTSDAPFKGEAADGVFWNDPALDIDWPMAASAASVGDRDAQLPVLSGQPYRFKAGTA